MHLPNVLIDIDNKNPTQPQLEEIKKTVCLRCIEKYDPTKRSIFVETSTKLMWWHGISKGQGGKYICKCL